MNGWVTRVCGGAMLALAMALAGCIAEQGDVEEDVEHAQSSLVSAGSPTPDGVGHEKVGQPSTGVATGATSGTRVPHLDDDIDPDPNPWVPGMGGPQEDESSSSQPKH